MISSYELVYRSDLRSRGGKRPNDRVRHVRVGGGHARETDRRASPREHRQSARESRRESERGSGWGSGGARHGTCEQGARRRVYCIARLVLHAAAPLAFFGRCPSTRTCAWLAPRTRSPSATRRSVSASRCPRPRRQIRARSREMRARSRRATRGARAGGGAAGRVRGTHAQPPLRGRRRRRKTAEPPT